MLLAISLASIEEIMAQNDMGYHENSYDGGFRVKKKEKKQRVQRNWDENDQVQGFEIGNKSCTTKKESASKKACCAKSDNAKSCSKSACSNAKKEANSCKSGCKKECCTKKEEKQRSRYQRSNN